MPPATGPVGRFTRKKGSKTSNPAVVLWRALCSSKKPAPIKNVFTSSELALWLLVFYYWLGSSFYTLTFENFSTLDSLYFLTTTMTTVGYGDVIPTSKGSRLFSTFWVTFGVCLVAAALVEVAGMILDARDALAARTKAALLKSMAGSTRKDNAAPIDDPEVAALLEKVKTKARAVSDLAAGAEAPPATLVQRVFRACPILDVVLYLTVYALVVGAAFSAIEGWTMIDGIYYSVVTGTSIGYGDLSPHTVTGRTLACFYLPFAVVYTSTHLSEVPARIFPASGTDSAARLAELMAMDLSIEGLLAMDTDGDGEITEFEFLRFMLCSADLADKGVLDSLHDRFCAMDEDGSGVLTKEDLVMEPLGIAPTAAAALVKARQAQCRTEVREVAATLRRNFRRQKAGVLRAAWDRAAECWTPEPTVLDFVEKGEVSRAKAVAAAKMTVFEFSIANVTDTSWRQALGRFSKEEFEEIEDYCFQRDLACTAQKGGLLWVHHRLHQQPPATTPPRDEEVKKASRDDNEMATAGNEAQRSLLQRQSARAENFKEDKPPKKRAPQQAKKRPSLNPKPPPSQALPSEPPRPLRSPLAASGVRYSGERRLPTDRGISRADEARAAAPDDGSPRSGMRRVLADEKEQWEKGGGTGSAAALRAVHDAREEAVPEGITAKLGNADAGVLKRQRSMLASAPARRPLVPPRASASTAHARAPTGPGAGPTDPVPVDTDPGAAPSSADAACAAVGRPASRSASRLRQREPSRLSGGIGARRSNSGGGGGGDAPGEEAAAGSGRRVVDV